MEGDVVRIASGWRTSKQIRHVVASIVAPFGEPVENRPHVLNEEERMDMLIKQRLLKDVRSADRGRQTSIARLSQARRQGYEIPSLEEAMANLKVSEQEEMRGRQEGRAEKHRGQAGQIVSNKERRVEKGRETKEEKLAGETVKEAMVQTA